MKIDWFHSVSKHQSQTGIKHVESWDEALTALVSQEWDDYLLDARNALGSAVKRPFIDDWNWAVSEANKTLVPELPDRLKLLIPATSGEMNKVVRMVLLQVRLACVEAHYADFVQKHFFGGLFTWLEQGHLPCGATEEYPSGKLLIF